MTPTRLVWALFCSRVRKCNSVLNRTKGKLLAKETGASEARTKRYRDKGVNLTIWLWRFIYRYQLQIDKNKSCASIQVSRTKVKQTDIGTAICGDGARVFHAKTRHGYDKFIIYLAVTSRQSRLVVRSATFVDYQSRLTTFGSRFLMHGMNRMKLIRFVILKH